MGRARRASLSDTRRVVASLCTEVCDPRSSLELDLQCSDSVLGYRLSEGTNSTCPTLAVAQQVQDSPVVVIEGDTGCGQLGQHFVGLVFVCARQSLVAYKNLQGTEMIASVGQ